MRFESIRTTSSGPFCIIANKFSPSASFTSSNTCLAARWAADKAPPIPTVCDPCPGNKSNRTTCHLIHPFTNALVDPVKLIRAASTLHLAGVELIPKVSLKQPLASLKPTGLKKRWDCVTKLAIWLALNSKSVSYAALPVFVEPAVHITDFILAGRTG